MTTTTYTKIETTACGRCGGTGHYSYCSMYGTRCFKCGGTGLQFTKVGSVANRYLTFIRSKPAREIVVGNLIRESFRLGTARAFGTVAEVGPCDQRPDRIAVTLTHHKLGGLITSYRPDELVRVAQSAEQKAETLQRAVEFQSHLTKAGKPRKDAPAYVVDFYNTLKK